MLKNRFRKYLPVVVDLETGGFDPEINAILEIAITLIEEENNKLIVGDTYRHHIEPFEGSIVEKESLEFTKIKLDHPLRNGINEKDALNDSFKIINKTKIVNKNTNECYKYDYKNIEKEELPLPNINNLRKWIKNEKKAS